MTTDYPLPHYRLDILTVNELYENGNGISMNRSGGFVLTLGGVLFVLLGVTGIATPVAADHHGYENSPMTDTGFTVDFPTETGHYPAADDEDSATMRAYPSIHPFASQINTSGLYLRTMEIRSPWLDYSDCNNFDNISAFGLDRGDNNEGTAYEYGLIQNSNYAVYENGHLRLIFYRIDQLGGNPPYANVDDEIVFALGEQSTGGACITPPDEPGWYQLEVFLSGIQHDDPDDYPSVDEINHEDKVGMTQLSTYVYVCKCEDESEARDRLGPPPGEPTPTSTPPTTPDPTPEPSPSPTRSPTTAPPSDTSPTRSRESNPNTPTRRDGAGFSPVVGLVAMLVTGHLHYRRQ